MFQSATEKYSKHLGPIIFFIQTVAKFFSCRFFQASPNLCYACFFYSPGKRFSYFNTHTLTFQIEIHSHKLFFFGPEVVSKTHHESDPLSSCVDYFVNSDTQTFDMSVRVNSFPVPTFLFVNFTFAIVNCFASEACDPLVLSLSRMKNIQERKKDRRFRLICERAKEQGLKIIFFQHKHTIRQ